jgi:TonB family protein
MNNSRLVSICSHLVIVALVLLLGRVTHKVVVARPGYTDQLVFAPIQVPPRLKLTRYAAVNAELPGATRLALSVPSTLHTLRVVEQPRMVALSVPEPLELPSPTLRVFEAPQAIVGAFGSPAARLATRRDNAGSVSTAGFGTSTGQATQRNGQAHVVTAGFSVAVASAPRAVATSTPKSPEQPVVTYEPAPVYSEQARAERIQGTIDIRVTFRADGSLEVLEIVHGIPELNQSALDVVRGIRFKAAASDVTTTVHVKFQLS